MDNGLMIKHMDLEYIYRLTAQNIKDNGRMTYKMVEEKIYGVINHLIKVNMYLE